MKKRACCISGLVLVLLLAVLVCLTVHPAWHIFSTWYHDPSQLPVLPKDIVNDASRLNRTTVTQLLKIESNRAAAEEQLRQLLERAAREKLRVSVAGARHSMGGHTIYPGGIAIDMLPFNQMSLDETTDVLHVGSGAKWDEIIPYLNERGKSIEVMQSNNSFSVGGSISVNCHGWQTGKPPIASTVNGFTLMTANGNITTCSRTQNPELFSLVLGGYGLFGIILDVDLRVVPNEMLQLKRIETTLENYAEVLRNNTGTDSSATLTYGRVDVSASHPMDSAILNVWQQIPGSENTTVPLKGLMLKAFPRAIFRGSVHDDYGKDLRWWAEKKLLPWVGDSVSSRNELLNISVDWFENRSPEDTDILHEYFVPPDHMDSFLQKAHKIVTRNGADLLNITVRDVQSDHDTFLKYADKPMLCLVMLFNQSISPAAETAMMKMTQDLIDAANDEKGCYYLPYRLHATRDQIRRAYPNIDEFFALKLKYDPAEIFQNEFYLKYK